MISARGARRVAAGLGSLTLLVGGLVAPAVAATTAGTSGDAPFCNTVDLTASYRATDAGAGHRYGRLVLRNTSDAACRIHGYGGLSYADSEGVQVGAAAARTPSRDPEVLLQPGQRVVSPVDEVVAQNYPRRRCHPVPVSYFQVYTPSAETSVLVPHRTTGCTNTAVVQVSHKAYRRP